MHIHFHSSHDNGHDHPHDRSFSRVILDLDSVLNWLTGPGMTDSQRYARNRAEAVNERYGNGVI